MPAVAIGEDFEPATDASSSLLPVRADFEPEQQQRPGYVQDVFDQADAQRAIEYGPEAARINAAATKFAITPLVPSEYTPPYLLGKAAGAVLPDSTATRVYTGELKAVGDLISSFTSPMNLALLGTGGLGKVAQRLIAGAFSAQAAAHAPEAYKQFQETNDPELKTRIAVGTLAGVGLPLLAMRAHGPEKTGEIVSDAVKDTIKEQAAAPPVGADFEPETPKPPAPDLWVGTAPTAEAPIVEQPAQQPEGSTPSPAVATPTIDPAAIQAANEAALPAMADAQGVEQPPTNTQVAPEAGFSVRPVATSEIASRPDLMQFKRMDDTASGTNANDKITAPYDSLKAGNLMLWEPINKQAYGLNESEKYIVANGHHRDAAAKVQSVESQNAQIIREAAGYSAGDARALAAEANIADGKGTIYDQAKFIREQAATFGPDAAMARAGQIGARSRNAATIAISSSPDLYASFVNEQITPEQTRAIAEAAPGDAALQRLGIKRATSGDAPAEIGNFIQAVKARDGGQRSAHQVDLFGTDDAAIRQAEAAAKRAGAIQREISDQIAAVAGAAKRPEKAAALGVDVRDPASVNAKLAQLQALRERARNWSGDERIRGVALGATTGHFDPAEMVTGLLAQDQPQVPMLRAGERGTAELFQGQDQPFNLAGETAADPEATQRAVETARRAQHEAAIWQEQNQVPFGFGPGAASAQEALSVGSQIKQLTETVTNELRTAKPSLGVAGRVQRAINAVGGKFVTGREGLQRGVNTARATWLAVKNAVLSPPAASGFKDALKDWQGADQRTSFEARKFVQELRDQIKDPLTRDAITNYIQADGDARLLAERAARSNIKYRPGYEAALRLTDGQKALAANVRQYFDGMLSDGIKAGILDHGLENYINQVWKRPNKFTQALQADLQSGKLQTNFQFARKRVFDSFFDGEQAGYAPASKDVSALVAAYDLSFNRSLAARGFIKTLREARAVDGEPVVKFSGMTQPIMGAGETPEAYLIRSRAMPASAVASDGRAYQVVDHPALRGWKFVVQDGANSPAYFQADMLVHPDHQSFLRNVLGTSAFKQGKLGAIVSPFLKLGAIAKQTKLSLSLFHLDQEGLHGLFHRVNPMNLDQINFDDPAQWSLVRGGLQVADYHSMELFAEGLRGGGLVSKIPVLGELQNRFNEFLFKDYIPRLKMTMALHALERNTKRYPNLPPDVVAELTARQGNAAFGELNYKLMGRSPTVQDALRLTLLAPDFLEARSRFVGQALKPYGREQRNAIILGAATLYVTGRVLNQWLDNDPHWDKPFSVIYNGREYRLRTVMGDAQELALDPRRFFYNRFSPWLRIGMTAATGRDQRGLRLTKFDQLKDALSWFVPIPFGRQENASIPQRILGSSGVTNKPAETPVQLTYAAALKWKEGLTDPKVQAEVRRAQQETYAQSDYAPLNLAIQAGDKEGATEAIVKLLQAGKQPATIAKYYSNLPGSPFTGSRALEGQWMRNMSDAERARYRSAVNQRINTARTFFQLLPNALQQARSR